MIIYLAGKVGYYDWRHRIVDGLGSINIREDVEWPIMKNCIGGKHDYSGPYFISCGHGSSHNPGTHGNGTNLDEPLISDGRRCCVALECFSALSRSNAIFAWLDDLTAYGTIFELGFAMSRCIPTFLAISNRHRYVINENLWFTICNVDLRGSSKVGYFDDVDQAFSAFLEHLDKRDDSVRLAKIESPIEMQFYKAMKNKTSELEPQWEVNASGHNYRLDFAIPSKMIAFELDGHEYHKSREQRTNDANRERNLQKEGWKVIRFTGTEIHNNLAKCVSDACQLISAEPK